MHAIILAQDFESYSTKRLADGLQFRGHQVTLVSPLHCTLRIDGESSAVVCAGQALPAADLVLPRCASLTSFGLTVVRHFEAAVALQLQMAGARCVNDPQAKLLAHDKFLSLQVLDAAGIPVPASYLTWDSDALDEIVGDRLGTPLVLKTVQGTWGVGVMRADSPVAARSTFETLHSMNQVVLAQRYVAEAAGQDVRAMVVGQRVVGAFRRTAPPGEFRANIHRGAEPEMVRLPAEVQALAVAATRALGLELAGVDLLETSGGPLLIEINPSPGWKQIERLSDTDVAGAIVSYLEDTAR
jgi:ribosomal protein S6--L-glutamate ligase